MRIKLEDGRIAEVIVRKQDDLFEYYIGNVKIGVLDTNVMQDNILMLENSLDNEVKSQIKDTIDGLSRKDLEHESNITRKIDTYIRELGDRNLHVRDIRRIELSEDEEEKKEEGKEDRKRNDSEELDEKDEAVKTKDVSIKQTIELSERANDMHDIRKWLSGRIPADVKELGVIESDDMNMLKDSEGNRMKNNTTRYSLVIINSKGEVEPLAKYIPELEQKDSSGNDPREEKYQVRDDGTVKYDSVLSEYSIGDKIIQIDNNEYGRVEVNIGEESRDSTQTMGVQLRDSNTTFVSDTSTRSVIGEYEQEGEDTVEKNLEEAKKHPEDDVKMDERDVDGDLETKSHMHIDDKILLERNKFIGEQYNKFLENPSKENLIKTIMANFILEGIYFYSGFMFFYNLERNGKMPGSAQEIRYINRDENTHLWLFRNLIRELQREEADIFTDELVNELRLMMKTGVEHEINWGNYVIGENIQGINKNLIDSYIKFLGNKRLKEIGLEPLFEGYDKNPAAWVDSLANANSVKTDFFEAKSTAYAKASVLVDDL